MIFSVGLNVMRNCYDVHFSWNAFTYSVEYTLRVNFMCPKTINLNGNVLKSGKMANYYKTQLMHSLANIMRSLKSL